MPEQLPDELDIRHFEALAVQMLGQGSARTLEEARSTIARCYMFPSWAMLAEYIDAVTSGEMLPLERAILDDDGPAIAEIVERDPAIVDRQLHWIRRKRHNYYLPLAYAAHCGKVRALEALLNAGADLHAGDGQSLRAASSSDRNLDALKLLVERGADLNSSTMTMAGQHYCLVDYPCMTLAPAALQYLLEKGATARAANVGMILASNERKPRDKAACIALMAAAGFAYPETAPMAIHRRDTDRLHKLLERRKDLLQQHFSEEEIFPGGFKISRPSPYAYATPLINGATLLHMAVELCDLEIAAWLLAHGADVNARSAMSEDGYGGWTPLFHAVVSLHQPRNFVQITELLLEHGADPRMRASIRKPVPGEASDWYTWSAVTAIEYARSFPEADLVNQAALQLLEKLQENN